LKKILHGLVFVLLLFVVTGYSGCQVVVQDGHQRYPRYPRYEPRYHCHEEWRYDRHGYPYRNDYCHSH